MVCGGPSCNNKCRITSGKNVLDKRKINVITTLPYKMHQTFLDGKGTYISVGSTHTAYPCHNLRWFHTRATRPMPQHLCNPHTTCSQTWMEIHSLLHLHCPGVCTWLKETEWLALRMKAMLLHTEPYPKLVLLLWSRLTSPCREFLFISLLSLPQSLLGMYNSLYLEITLPPFISAVFWKGFPLSSCKANAVSSTDTSFYFCIPSKRETRPSFLMVGSTELWTL